MANIIFKAKPAHLDAVQGSNEQRTSRTNWYDERAAQATDVAVRQEYSSKASFACLDESGVKVWGERSI